MSCSEEPASQSAVSCSDLMNAQVNYCAFRRAQLAGLWRFACACPDATDATCAPLDGQIEFFTGDASDQAGTFTLYMRSTAETGPPMVRTGTFQLPDAPEMELTFGADAGTLSASLECLTGGEVLHLRDSRAALFPDSRWRVATRVP
jgi:hypothetical protein